MEQRLVLDVAMLSQGTTSNADAAKRLESSFNAVQSSPASIFAAAGRALQDEKTVGLDFSTSDELPGFICMPLLPPPRLTIFGAGDDAKPIVSFASQLGWYVTVADGRRHLLRQERFPEANHLHQLTYQSAQLDGPSDSPGQHELAGPAGVRTGDIAVILTHSYEQDRELLKVLLPEPLRYLGILGPRHRTARLIESIAGSVGLSPAECMTKLHSPVGLSIGSAEPPVIALAIIAEIQAELSGRTVSVTPKTSRASDIPFSGELNHSYAGGIA